MKYMRLRIPNEKTKLMQNKKDMDIKTLALYLGCECEIITGRHVGERGRLRGVDSDMRDGVMLSECTKNFKPDEDYIEDCISLPISSVKLLLRPLSSMTEKEAREIKGMRTYIGEEPHIFDNVFNKEDYPHALVKYTSEEFQYLLSKGFDLFGLIEKQEAIDSTKV